MNTERLLHGNFRELATGQTKEDRGAAGTPIQNTVATVLAVRDFNGRSI